MNRVELLRIRVLFVNVPTEEGELFPVERMLMRQTAIGESVY